MNYSAAVKAARLQAVADLLAGGALRCYTGVQPTPGGAPAGTLVGSIPLASPAGVMSGSTLTVTPGEAQATAAGGITWARIVTSAGVWVMDGVVGIPGSGADFTLENPDVFVGGFIRITTGTFQEP